MSKLYPSEFAQIPLGDLENMNTDRSPDYPVMIRGQAYKTSAGEWYYADGQSRSYDASFMRVSSIGSGSFAPLSADGSSVSAKQEDASNLRVSTFWAQTLDATNDAVSAKSADASFLRISAFSGDAALMRVSSIGTGSFAPLSADSSAVSAKQENASNMRISAFSNDASLMRVSALGVSVSMSPSSADGSSVSAKQENAANLRVSSFWANTLDATNDAVSAKSSDGGTMRVSALLADNPTITGFIGRVSALGVTLAASQSLSARSLEGTAFIGSVSCGGGLVSATMKEGTSFIGQVSAILKDNPTNATYLGRVSGVLVADTVGRLTTFRSLSLSASQAIKSTAGAIYGYYLWNTTTVPQYVKFTNTSGAINVGTDVPVFMAMVPASGGANVEFTHGIKGFTAGIGVHATSAVADSGTTAAAASAVGGTILYA